MMSDQGMTTFVIGNNASILLAHYQWAQGAKLDTCQGFFKALVIDRLSLATRRR
jgi:hypothetical protein